jgi:PPOX class probable F420-dependent enzyme
MGLDPRALDAAALAFLAERHVGTLTTVRPDGSPHVCAIAFTWDDDAKLARLITFDGSTKVRNVEAAGATGGPAARAVVAQVDGPRWLALEGPARVVRDPDAIAEAVRRHGQRYKVPSENPRRVAIEIAVDRILGRATSS